MNKHKRYPLDIREQAARLVLLTWNIRTFHKQVTQN